MRRLTDRTGISQIQRDMEFMCATVGVRLAGSPEEERVADYMLDRFRELGLVNIGKLAFSCKRWLPGSASVQVTPGGPVLDAQQVTHSPATPPEGIEGDLVFFEPVDWEQGLRVGALDGKIGLFLGGYGESERVFIELHQSGLAALLFVDTRMQTDWPIANGVGERFMKHITKPMAYLSLMDAYGLAREGVSRVRLTCSGSMRDATSWNAAGELPGQDPHGRIIVVSGHIDSVSIGQGADDNASGIAATLECARRLRGIERKHTLRFIGFGAEEQLSVGSNRYVCEQAADLERIAWVCNFDSIGAHFGLSEVMCTGTPEMEAYVRGVVDERLEYGTAYAGVCPYQDQFPFTARGIPGVWFGRNTHVPGHWYHHSEHNTLEAVSCDEIAWAAETACAMLAELASSGEWPFERAVDNAMRERIDGYLRELF